MIKFIIISALAYFFIKPAVLVHLEDKRRRQEVLISFMRDPKNILNPVRLYDNCLDADKDTCAKDDENCMWRTYTCLWCKEDYKIAKRALTGKYMIADHRKICKGLK